ncbi:hypothetical protein ABZZ46_34525 [Streptomyces rochei]|uniref:hypothetical protein n=1 Tax=Streptomyces rochei TaxID=1928 RepID=UPI00339EC990
MRSTTGASGIHVFTGLADSRSAAIRIARDAYHAAHTAQQTGRKKPCERPNGWGARGYRAGWNLDWNAATALLWQDQWGWHHTGIVDAEQ